MKYSRTGILKSTVMVDFDTFLTTLYVMIDDFCKEHPSPEPHGGAPASLTRSEVLTLAKSEPVLIHSASGEDFLDGRDSSLDMGDLPLFLESRVEWAIADLDRIAPHLNALWLAV